MKPIVDDGSGVQFDVTGLAYEPIVGLRQAETPAPAAAVADVTSDSGSVRDAAPSVMSSAGGLTSGAPMGIAIGEPTGLPGPIWVDDSFKVGDTNGDGFGDVIVIDDGSIDTDWYDGGSYDGGSYDYSYSGQWTTAVGDINGDGLEDALVATYAWDAAGTYSASSRIVFGGGEQGFQITEGGQAVYGWQVSAAGDVNGDGLADLLVNTYDYADGAASVYVVFGAADGFGGALDLTSLDGSNGFKVSTGEGTYSYVSAAGDVNGDGFADLSVGVYDYASGTYADYVVYGAAAGSDVRLQLVAILGDYPLGSA